MMDGPSIKDSEELKKLVNELDDQLDIFNVPA